MPETKSRQRMRFIAFHKTEGGSSVLSCGNYLWRMARPPLSAPSPLVIWSASTLKNNFGERVNSQDLFTAGREKSPAIYLRFPKGMIELTNSSCPMERRVNNCNYSRLRVNYSINRGPGILPVYDDIDCDIASYSPRYRKWPRTSTD